MDPESLYGRPFSLHDQDHHDRWLLQFPKPRLCEPRPWAAPIPDHRLVTAYRHQIDLAWKHLHEARAKRDAAYCDYVKFRSSETDLSDPWFLRYLGLREGAEQFRLMLWVLLAVWSGARRGVRR